MIIFSIKHKEDADMSNAINPEHYNRLDPQPKDVIRSWGLNFNLGNAVKYVARAGHKDDIVQDLKKAQEYIQFEIDAIEAERKAQEPKKRTISKQDCIDRMIKDMFPFMRSTFEDALYRVDPSVTRVPEDVEDPEAFIEEIRKRFRA